MAAKSNGWLATCWLILFVVPAACDGDVTEPADAISAQGGQAPGIAEGGAAGSDSARLEGGAAGASGIAGSGGTNPEGEGGWGAQAGAAEPGSAGAGGWAATPEPSGPERLSLCARLDMSGIHSNLVALAYDDAVYADPCVGWTTALYGVEHHAQFLNDLALWNLKFWGCQGEGVSDFKLLFEPVALSAGDAELLLEHYLTAATQELELSSGEVNEMRAALERLAESVVADPSSLPSHSDCLLGEGGAGGAPGAGGADEAGGIGGAGGADEAGGVGGAN